MLRKEQQLLKEKSNYDNPLALFSPIQYFKHTLIKNVKALRTAKQVYHHLRLLRPALSVAYLEMACVYIKSSYVPNFITNLLEMQSFQMRLQYVVVRSHAPKKTKSSSYGIPE